MVMSLHDITSLNVAIKVTPAVSKLRDVNETRSVHRGTIDGVRARKVKGRLTSENAS